MSDVKDAAPKGEPEGSYEGPNRLAPYGTSRLAPAYDLVDAAKEIQKADEQLALMTGGKLELIAKQIRALRTEAERLVARAEHDARLHRAQCSFEKKPGGVYHLYRKDDGALWFSLLAPDEWSIKRAQTFEGSYRLEADMSFTRLDVDDPDGASPRERLAR